jgi:hypothetical protein
VHEREIAVVRAVTDVRLCTMHHGMRHGQRTLARQPEGGEECEHEARKQDTAHR